jgi:outer membrane protein assembly factor BamB/TPR repeat protein
VYVGSYDKKLYAINGKTGVKLWEFETGDYVLSSPAIGSAGTVYVGSDDKKLYALKTESLGPAKSPWPMRGQNAQHTGRATAVAELPVVKTEPIAEARKSGTVLWEFETEGAVYSSPAIGTDGTVYIASATSGRGRPTIFALDGKTGVKRWEVAKSGIVAKNSISIGKGGVVYLTTISQVLSFDGQTGKAGWSRAGVGDTTPTFGADGTLYTVSGRASRRVHALDVTKLKKGRLSQIQKWYSSIAGTFFIGAGSLYKVSSLPVIGSDGTLFIGEEGGMVFALDGKTGVKKWEFDAGGPIWSSAAIGSDGMVYIGSATKKMDGDRAGIDGERGKVYALNPATGEKKWEAATGGPVVSSPAIGADGSVYVGSDDKKVYALDGKTGAKKWEFETGGWVHSSPAIGSDGTVYVGSWDKKIYALDGKSGAKKWEFVTGGRVLSSPTIGPEGTLYIGSLDKKIYAIQTSSQGLAKSPWPMRGQNPQHTGRATNEEDEPAVPDALAELKRAAQTGYAGAQYQLGRKYLLGEDGLKKNPELAGNWLLKAATQGNGSAQYYLAGMFLNGRDRPKDLQQATHWARLAVQASPNQAQFKTLLDRILEQATPAQVRQAEASVAAFKPTLEITFAKLKELAAGGDPRAQTVLGYKYIMAQDGLEKDPGMAGKWWLRAARQGWPMAQNNLSVLFSSGRALPKDLVQAYYWASLADKGGIKRAKQTLTKIRGEATPAQIEQAKAQINAFKPVPEKNEGVEESATEPTNPDLTAPAKKF